MQYPALMINRGKLYNNIKVITSLCREAGIEVSAVTKVFCAHPEIVKVFADAGVQDFADSRLQNLKRIPFAAGRKMLLRMPMISEAEEVVRFSDISCNTEMKTVEALSAAAQKHHVTHGIVMMIEMGDLREGILPEDAMAFAQMATRLPGVRLMGVGSNFNCYGGVLPTVGKLSQLVSIAKTIETACGLQLPIISGGNSGSIYLIREKKMPAGINHLRLGEVILRGYETSFQQKVEGLYADVFTLRAEIIELKDKPSVPYGEIGLNAFGAKPQFTDKGSIRRAILACGRQDVLWDHIVPLDGGIELIGASSDHLLLDVTRAEKPCSVGDTMDFSLDYGAILAACTSEYVSKIVC